MLCFFMALWDYFLSEGNVLSEPAIVFRYEIANLSSNAGLGGLRFILH